MSSGSPSFAQHLLALTRAIQLTPADERLAGEVERLAKRHLTKIESPLDKRNELIRRLAAEVRIEAKRKRAEHIAELADTYASERWRRYRDLVDVPADHVGLDVWLWKLHQLYEREPSARWPLQWRQLMSVLESDNRCSRPTDLDAEPILRPLFITKI